MMPIHRLPKIYVSYRRRQPRADLKMRRKKNRCDFCFQSQSDVYTYTLLTLAAKLQTNPANSKEVKGRITKYIIASNGRVAQRQNGS